MAKSRVCALAHMEAAGGLRGDGRYNELIHGRLRCGAELLGSSAHDRDLNTANLSMLMRSMD